MADGRDARTWSGLQGKTGEARSTLRDMTGDHRLGITEMARESGLSEDALRWYEREGILPPVPRDAGGRRRYGERQRGILRLVLALREAGMSTADMRDFVALLGQGARTHGRRLAILEATRAELAARRARLDAADAALAAKAGHYAELIAAGRDCEGAPVPTADRAQQAAGQDLRGTAAVP